MSFLTVALNLLIKSPHLSSHVLRQPRHTKSNTLTSPTNQEPSDHDATRMYYTPGLGEEKLAYAAHGNNAKMVVSSRY